MSVLSQEQVILAFIKLGKAFANPTETLENAIFTAQNSNAWFTPENVKKSFQAFSEMLNEQDLNTWSQTIQFNPQPKKVGLILAGNIPMVGLHDILCVLATGNIAQIKLSSSDEKLIKITLSILIEFEPNLANHIVYVDRLTDFEAVIATGSNNSSRYFDYYFSKVPNIIRKNRNSVAILTGNESQEDIENLGNDIFDYFGLGCRSVSKLYIPDGYDIANFYKPLEKYQPIINYFKYTNNYDYNKSIYLVNSAQHFDNGFLLLKEDKALVSPLTVVFYEYYSNLEQLNTELNVLADQIQCVVGQVDLDLPTLNFGDSQHPKIWDYADNVNTIEFLNGIN